MLKILTIVIPIYITCNCAFAEKADITNIITLKNDFVVQTISTNLNITEKELVISPYPKVKNRTSESSIKELVFLMGDKNTNSIEQLSDAFKGEIKKYEKSGIPKISYFNEYSVYEKTTGIEIARLSLKPTGGWGYEKSIGMAYESYMLLGLFHEKVQGAMRLGGKRTTSVFSNGYEKIYSTKPGEAPFTKLEKGLWSYSYMLKPTTSVHEKNQLTAVGVSYFEKYAKSFQLKIFSLSEEAKSTYPHDIQDIQRITEHITEKINQEAKSKGIHPDEKSLKELLIRRNKHFGADGINSYILSIERNKSYGSRQNSRAQKHSPIDNEIQNPNKRERTKNHLDITTTKTTGLTRYLLTSIVIIIIIGLALFLYKKTNPYN